jgi:cell division protein FtsQ
MSTRALQVLAFVLIAVGVIGLVRWLPSQPVETIEVSGDFEHLSLEHLHAVLEEQFGHELLKAPLADIQRKVATLVWVDKVDVRRVWPDKIAVRVTEHKPAFRWRDAAGQQALIAESGLMIWDAFAAGQNEYQALTVLVGEVSGVHVIAEGFAQLKTWLGKGLALTELERTGYNAWIAVVDGKPVHLGSGLAGNLPDEEATEKVIAQQRVARLKTLHAELASEWQKVKYLDLRHAGGVAVAWL